MTTTQPGIRGASIALRTVHLASFGILLGGHTFGIEGDRLLIALCLTIASGIGLMALELFAIGLHWLFMGKGIMVLAKLALLLLVPFFWEGRVQILLLVLAIGSVGSHMPGRYRHYSLLHRRAIGRGEAFRFPFSASRPAVGPTASLYDRDLKRR